MKNIVDTFGYWFSVLPLQSIGSPIQGQLFAAIFSYHSTLDGPNLPSSAPCWVLSCLQTSFLLIALEEQLRNCIHHSLQSGDLKIIHNSFKRVSYMEGTCTDNMDIYTVQQTRIAHLRITETSSDLHITKSQVWFKFFTNSNS